ncbi:MAG TPA: hypothetical protein VM925_00185 [Labilithrix sp.]|nr:hypothetical protein [Labilithrix sp.]
MVLALAGVAACSYVFELPASSAPIPGVDASDDVIDGSTDAPIADAPAPFDAPPAIRFCASQTSPFLYCNDFDDVPLPDLASIGTAQVAGGQLVLSSAVALSPPRSLLASIVRGTNASTAVTRSLGTNPDGVTLSFDMLVSAWSTTDAQLSQIDLVEGTAQCIVRIDGAETTWSVTQVCNTSGTETAKVTTTSTSPIVRGRWQRFSLGVRFAPTKGITLDVDGARVVDAVGVDPLQRAQTSVALGTRLLPAGTVTLFQDNILVTSP